MPKLKQNLTNLKAKTLHSQRGRIIAVSAILVIFVAGGYLIWSNTKIERENTADCSTLSREATTLLVQKQNQAAYDKLKPGTESCSNVKNETIKKPENIKDYISLIQFNHDLAVAAYAAGDKTQAKVYSARGVKLSETRTPEQTNRITQDQVSQLNELLMDMYRMQDGVYVYKPPLDTSQKESQ